MNRLFKILHFFRILDENDVISLTNLFMIILLFKIYSTNAISIQDISIMFVAVSNYSLKKFMEK